MPHTPPAQHPSSGSGAWLDEIKPSSAKLPADVEDFVYYLGVQKNHPATTVRGYRADLWKFVAFRRHYAPRPFEQVCEQFSADEWRELLREYQKALVPLLPHARSRARSLIALRRFLVWAHREQLISEDLSGRVEIPRFVTADPHPIASDDVPTLLAALPAATLSELRDRALIYFLLTTGCRITEALSIDRAALRAEGTRVLGKGGKYRSVFLTQGAWDVMDDYLRARGMDDAPSLFISFAPRDFAEGKPRPGNRLTPSGARKVLNRLRRTLGTTPELENILADFRSPHVARHTAATTLLESGSDVRTVQEVLGHSSLETLKVYTEITDARKRDAYRRLGEFLGESAKTDE